MKQCPKCRQTYSDEMLNFCLDDGELLTAFTTEPPASRYADDPPPTVMLDSSRRTNPVGWPGSPPQWQPNQSPVKMATPFTPMTMSQNRDQTIPVIALILGIISIVLVCCYAGIWLGLPAAVLGFLGLRNANSDPTRYGGRGMAIAGMILGIVSFLGFLLMLVFIGIGQIS